MIGTENELYADMHGDGRGQHSMKAPPPYTPPPPPPQQQQQQHPGMFPGYPNPSLGEPYDYAAPTGPGYGALYEQAAQKYAQAVKTYSIAMIYSCFVFFCCCNLVFGLIGFILALMANDSAMSNPQGARKLGRASYIVSTAGIVVSVIIVAVVGSLHLGGNCPYTHHGICYQAKSDIPHAECEKIRGYFDDFSCFYDY